MRITHPQAAYRGIAPENMFFVYSDTQIQLGSGHLISFMQPELSPARPHHIYMQIDAQPSAYGLLLGALLARAEVLSAQNPGLPARLYTQLSPDDRQLLPFLHSCGMANDDAEDLVAFSTAQGAFARPPMGVQYASVPLDSQARSDGFAARLNAMRISPIQPDQLTLWREQPHFLALGFYKNNRPVSELLICGTGKSATLVSAYTLRDFRRQGMARNLILLACGILHDQQGVETLYANVFRKNEPQAALMKSLGSHFVKTVSLLPGMDL